MAQKVHTTLRPLHDRVLVKRLAEGDEKHGSIIIPDTAKEKPHDGKVVLAEKFDGPSLTKGGVTVARKIDLKAPYETMGAQMLKKVAARTSKIAGDGTTTATALPRAIFRGGLKNVTAGANPMALQR